MKKEIFDVVDTEDRVIARAPRAEVHAQGLRHRAVHVLVRDSKGNVFLQRRAESKDMHPGLWDSSVSGHLDAGERYDDAAVREMGEELGINPEPGPVRVLHLGAGIATGNEFIRVYSCAHAGPITVNAAEISDGRWLPPNEIDQWIQMQPDEFSPVFRLVWRRFRKAQPG